MRSAPSGKEAGLGQPLYYTLPTHWLPGQKASSKLHTEHLLAHALGPAAPLSCSVFKLLRHPRRKAPSPFQRDTEVQTAGRTATPSLFPAIATSRAVQSE